MREEGGWLGGVGPEGEAGGRGRLVERWGGDEGGLAGGLRLGRCGGVGLALPVVALHVRSSCRRRRCHAPTSSSLPHLSPFVLSLFSNFELLSRLLGCF